MEYILTLSREDKRLVKIIENVVKKWKKQLQLDHLWNIEIEVVDSEEMEGAVARVDTSNSEYFVATIEVTHALLQLPQERFFTTINEVVFNELVHLVMIDFYRTAQLAAVDNEKISKELRYKYEQFTSRFQRAFVDLDKQTAKATVKKIIITTEGV
jgi:ribosomal protein L29